MAQTGMDNFPETVSALWSEAISQFEMEAELSEEEKAYLRQSHSPEQVLQELRSNRPSSMLNHKQKQRRRKVQNSVTCVLQIVEVIDIALNLAQVVCVLLCLINGQSIRGCWNVYDMIEEQFYKFDEFLRRVRINRHTHTIRAGLDVYVVRVLKQMLHICAIATRDVRKGSFKQRPILQALTPDAALVKAVSELTQLFKMEKQLMLTAINSGVTEIESHTREISGNISEVQRTGNEVRNGVQYLAVQMDKVVGLSASSQASLEEVHARLNELAEITSRPCEIDELALIRTWLEPVDDYEDDYIHNLARRKLGTCDWALNVSDPAGKIIRQWLEGKDPEHAIVWLKGNPAQGKSVLAAYLIRCVKECGLQETSRPCLYFFCRHDDEAKRSAKRLLRTIGFTLATIQDGVRAKYLSQIHQGISLANTSASLLAEKLFKEALAPESSIIHCVIDGFDELETRDCRDLASLLGLLASRNIRILVISRPERDIKVELEARKTKFREVKMMPESTNRDIKKAVTSVVEMRLQSLPLESQQKIIETITKKAGGVFLWATLVLDMICRQRSERAIFKALNGLPLATEMKDLYTVIVRKMLKQTESLDDSDDSERELAKAILTWTFCSIRPLALCELECALRLRFGSIVEIENTVRDLTGALIQKGEDNQITAVHATVKEFFMTAEAGDFHILENVGHRYVADVCMDYLNGVNDELPRFLHTDEDSLPQPDEMRDAFPFVEYASQYLFHHLQHCSTSDTLKENVIDFLEGQRVLTWIEALGTFNLVSTLSIAATVIDDTIFSGERQRYGRDLCRIGLQIDEAVRLYPRSVHMTMFPEECKVAQEVRGEFVSCEYPRFEEWPAAKATRSSSQASPKGKNATVSYSPCGEYLVLGQLRLKEKLHVDLDVYRTLTYQRVGCEILPFTFEGKTKVLPLEDHFSFFKICCDAEQKFRVVISFAVGRVVSKRGTEVFSRCIVAEYFSRSPLQNGVWRTEVQLDIPMTPAAPVLDIAMNREGMQILAWHDRVLYYWRIITGVKTTITFTQKILAADFVSIGKDNLVVCIAQGFIRLYDTNCQRLRDLPIGFNPSRAYIDPEGADILLPVSSGGDRYTRLRLIADSKRTRSGSFSFTQSDIVSIRKYFGSFGGSSWEYKIWENGRRRLALETGQTAPAPIYPHPTKPESVLPFISQYGFVVFDDPLCVQPLEVIKSISPTVPGSYHQIDLEQCRRSAFNILEQHKIWLHEHNCRASPCGTYLAFMSCNDASHSRDCESCLTKPSRLGIIDHSTDPPGVCWLDVECCVDFESGRVGFTFDEYCRLLVFSNNNIGVSVYMASAALEFRLEFLGVLRHPEMILPPCIHSKSPSELYFACYSQRMPLEIGKWELKRPSKRPRPSKIRPSHNFERLNVVSAEINSSTLVFITNRGLLGTINISDSNAKVRPHFWFPSHMTMGTNDGIIRCRLKCRKDGHVTIEYNNGEYWHFMVITLGQTLQTEECIVQNGQAL